MLGTRDLASIDSQIQLRLSIDKRHALHLQKYNHDIKFSLFDNDLDQPLPPPTTSSTDDLFDFLLD
jgi:hypothetical protein